MKTVEWQCKGCFGKFVLSQDLAHLGIEKHIPEYCSLYCQMSDNVRRDVEKMIDDEMLRELKNG